MALSISFSMVCFCAFMWWNYTKYFCNFLSFFGFFWHLTGASLMAAYVNVWVTFHFILLGFGFSLMCFFFVAFAVEKAWHCFIFDPFQSYANLQNLFGKPHFRFHFIEWASLLPASLWLCNGSTVQHRHSILCGYMQLLPDERISFSVDCGCYLLAL